MRCPFMADQVIIVKALRTSLACPSQWDAWDDQGRYYYCRYRNGCGSVHRAASQEVYEDAYENASLEKTVNGYVWHGLEAIEFVADFEYGDEYDGCMEFEQFCRLADLCLTPNWDNVSYLDYMRGRLPGVEEE